MGKEQAAFPNSPAAKNYQAALKGVKPGQAKLTALPAKPADLPQKPTGAMQLYMKENPGALAKVAKDWRELGAEGQKKWVDQAEEMKNQYEKDMEEFKKSVEGKK